MERKRTVTDDLRHICCHVSCTPRYLGIVTLYIDILALRNSCWAEISVFLRVIHDCARGARVCAPSAEPCPVVKKASVSSVCAERPGRVAETRAKRVSCGSFYINLTKSPANVLAYGAPACDGHKLRALAELRRHTADEAGQHSRRGCGRGTVRRGA